MCRFLLTIQMLITIAWLTGYITVFSLPLVLGVDVGIVSGAALMNAGKRPIIASFLLGALGFAFTNGITIALIAPIALLDFTRIVVYTFPAGLLFAGVPATLTTYIRRY
jgi:hypothetical protein